MYMNAIDSARKIDVLALRIKYPLSAVETEARDGAYISVTLTALCRSEAGNIEANSCINRIASWF